MADQTVTMPRRGAKRLGWCGKEGSVEPSRVIDPWTLWAKGAPKDEQAPFHPLICHLIDVATVARAIWERVVPLAARARFAATLGVDEGAAGQWVTLWAGLHDLGKGSPAFFRQMKGTDGKIRAPHQWISALALPSLLTTVPFELPQPLAKRVATVVGGHHGAFPRSEVLLKMQRDDEATGIGLPPWDEARAALARALGEVLELPDRIPAGDLDNANAMWLAGLVSVADWIGSDEKIFCYAAEGGAVSWSASYDLQAYAALARKRTKAALHLLGWSRTASEPEVRAFRELFPSLREKGPNALQRAVIELAETLPGPALVIVNAPMGEGKTEAGLYLAAHAEARHGLRGHYVALPTRATSDQMFGRVREYLDEQYGHDSIVNLQLLHGLAALSGEFAWLKKEGKRLLEIGEIADEAAGYDGAPAGVVAAEWFTRRKRGLLSPYGVGTVDQGLLAVLQTRHVFVRLFGLAGKTVVIDEVHAYDAYMSTLLERLLTWLGALGCRVVLLSATLPNAKRQALVDAYANGIGEVRPRALTATYPCISWVAKGIADDRPVDASELGEKTVGVRWVRSSGDQATDDRALSEDLKAALANGGCAAVICTTVRRAQEVYRRLAVDSFFQADGGDGLPVLGLLHARFLYDDRERLEKQALIRFGKPEGKVRRPKRAVLVATQVIEQSLDLDFDLMVTDLAPVDLVLQRIGRLQRHRGWDPKRPSRLQASEVWIREPALDSGGLPRFEGGMTYVYDEHILLRSWLALKPEDGQPRTITIPRDVSDLIERVYDVDLKPPQGSPDALAVRWKHSLDRYKAEIANEKEEAELRWIKLPGFDGSLWHMTADPREEGAPGFHQAHRALTRLTENGTDVILLFGTWDHPTIDRAGADTVHPNERPSLSRVLRILRRSVRVPGDDVAEELEEWVGSKPPGWRESSLLRHYRLVVLSCDGTGRVGTLLFRLEESVGLTVERIGRGNQ